MKTGVDSQNMSEYSEKKKRSDLSPYLLLVKGCLTPKSQEAIQTMQNHAFLYTPANNQLWAEHVLGWVSELQSQTWKKTQELMFGILNVTIPGSNGIP